MQGNGHGLARVMVLGLIEIGMSATVGMAVVFNATGRIPGELAGLAGSVVGSLGAGLVSILGRERSQN